MDFKHWKQTIGHKRVKNSELSNEQSHTDSSQLGILKLQPSSPLNLQMGAKKILLQQIVDVSNVFLAFYDT